MEERQESMKVWRRGFMRCRRREGPCGSHHEEARREKCDISVGETDDWFEASWAVQDDVENWYFGVELILYELREGGL